MPPEEAAPILDSAKDSSNSSSAEPATPTDQTSSEAPPPAEPAAPPPETDQAAQQDISAPPPEQQSTQTDTGEKADFTFIAPKPPENNDRVKVVERPKNDNGGVVFQIGINLYINNPTQERDRFYDRAGRRDLLRGSSSRPDP